MLDIAESDHCENFIYHSEAPLALRYFILVKRLPAMDRFTIIEKNGEPMCYADWQGQRVRLTMASRFGDVGITTKHEQSGYEHRVLLKELSNFSEEP